MEATPRSSVPKPTGLVSTKSEEKYQVSTGDPFRDNESREKWSIISRPTPFHT